ncbi:hypothetical protein EMIHUDRAFT_451085, partial [Emiliania huxleyi CCMP1516]|uniref:Uncharacterized protein n=2 Tax=Emiliania huxleyi TaxID=2903 RepID=A0A0D3J9A3_EMIH1
PTSPPLLPRGPCAAARHRLHPCQPDRLRDRVCPLPHVQRQAARAGRARARWSKRQRRGRRRAARGGGVAPDRGGGLVVARWLGPAAARAQRCLSAAGPAAAPSPVDVQRGRSAGLARLALPARVRQAALRRLRARAPPCAPGRHRRAPQLQRRRPRPRARQRASVGARAAASVDAHRDADNQPVAAGCRYAAVGAHARRRRARAAADAGGRASRRVAARAARRLPQLGAAHCARFADAARLRRQRPDRVRLPLRLAAPRACVRREGREYQAAA